MKKFQVGDKVYLPYFSTRVLEIESNSNSTTVPLRISTGYCSESFTKEGCINGHVTSTGIVLATQENKELLDKLYGVEFEAPPPKTVTIHFEMPVTFVPELNKDYWFINTAVADGVECTSNTGMCIDRMLIKRGVWRTKEEAMVVANAIFGMRL